MHYFVEFADLRFAEIYEKFVDLQFADWHTVPEKFTDLRLRNEPKNLQIFDLWTLKKVCLPTSVFLYSAMYVQ